MFTYYLREKERERDSTPTHPFDNLHYTHYGTRSFRGCQARRCQIDVAPDHGITDRMFTKGRRRTQHSGRVSRTTEGSHVRVAVAAVAMPGVALGAYVTCAPCAQRAAASCCSRIAVDKASNGIDTLSCHLKGCTYTWSKESGGLAFDDYARNSKRLYRMRHFNRSPFFILESIIFMQSRT